MVEPTKAEIRRSRLIIIAFIGVALLLSLTTIIGTYSTLSEPVEPVPAPAATTPATGG